MSREKELNLKQSVDSQKKEKIAEVVELSHIVDMSKKWKWRVMPNGAVFFFKRKIFLMRGVCSCPGKNIQFEFKFKLKKISSTVEGQEPFYYVIIFVTLQL